MNAKIEDTLKKVIKAGEPILWQSEEQPSGGFMSGGAQVYVITDHRFITATEKFQKHSCVEFSTCHKIRLGKDDEGKTFLSVGARTEGLTSAKKLQKLAYDEARMDGCYTDCESYVIYDIPNEGKDVKEALKGVFEL